MGKFEEEWQKMLRGERYDAFMPEFYERLVRTREILQDYNNTAPADAERLTAILRGLLGSCGERITVNQPFRCDYGCNIHVGEDFVANFNFTVLDEAEVRIGRKVLIGPNVSIYTACHPLERGARRHHHPAGRHHRRQRRHRRRLRCHPRHPLQLPRRRQPRPRHPLPTLLKWFGDVGVAEPLLTARFYF